MSRRTTGGTLAAWMIIAAIVGFAGGAFAGTQSDSDNTPRTNPTSGNSATPEATKKPKPGIELTAVQDAVSANSRLPFAVTLRPAEGGVELKLQRNVNDGGWQDFPNISTWTTDENGKVDGQYVKSGQTGTNEFRLVRVDDDAVKSNTVAVTIS